MTLPIVFFNGGCIPKNEAIIPVSSNAVAYGESCFDTLRSYKGKFLRIEAHYQRLKRGAETLGIELPYTVDDFKSHILEVLAANQLLEQEAKVRTQVGVLSSGLYPDNPEFFVLIEATPISVSGNLIRLMSSSFPKIASDSLHKKLKTSQYLNNLLAFREAQDDGFDDAILCNAAGRICETTIANLFWIKGSVIFTPSDKSGLLPGITRSFVIEGIKEKGYEVREGNFRISELKSADCVFITNSLKEWIPVCAIDETLFTTHDFILKTIFNHFETKRNSELC